MKSKAERLNLNRLEEILMKWNYRAIGNTQAMIEGALGADCLVLVMHQGHAKDLINRGVDRKKIITLDQIPEVLRGIRNTILVDHFVLTTLIRESLREC